MKQRNTIVQLAVLGIALSIPVTLEAQEVRDFNQQVRITTSGATTNLRVQLHTINQRDGDFARLRLTSFGCLNPDGCDGPERLPFWDIAAGRGEMNLFYERYGNLMRLTAQGNVIIDPEKLYARGFPVFIVNGIAGVDILHADILQISGGGDVAESFSVTEEAQIEPGTVMVIDENGPGSLKVSDVAFDTKVAGVVSGARGLGPGLILQGPTSHRSKVLVAIAGRVYVKADANSRPIKPGDLLTTSELPGHAMSSDENIKQGAVIGKAMSGLSDGTGLILLLVNLQ